MRIARNRAYSLMETLAVMTVIAILASLVLPGFLNSMLAGGLNAGTLQFEKDLDVAKWQAIQGRKTLKLFIPTRSGEFLDDAFEREETVALRSYCFVEFQEESDSWVLLGSLKSLPDGVVFDTSNDFEGQVAGMIQLDEEITISYSGDDGEQTGALITIRPNGSFSPTPENQKNGVSR